jgi:hypothetical protein
MFGEDHLTIQGHFEGPAGRFDQTNLRIRVGFSDLSRQTGGSRLVVSNYAVFDLDQHGHLRLR